MSDELQNHMNKGMYGTPQINPDDRRNYLGTFRKSRCRHHVRRTKQPGKFA